MNVTPMATVSYLFAISRCIIWSVRMTTIFPIANANFELRYARLVTLAPGLRKAYARNGASRRWLGDYNILAFLEALLITYNNPQLNTGLKASKELQLFT